MLYRIAFFPYNITIRFTQKMKYCKNHKFSITLVSNIIVHTPRIIRHKIDLKFCPSKWCTMYIEHHFDRFDGQFGFSSILPYLNTVQVGRYTRKDQIVVAPFCQIMQCKTKL